MKESDFYNLSADKQASLIIAQGKFVECREYINVKIILYSINTTFVELFYNNRTNNFISISIANDDDLTKYLTNINLDFTIF